MSYIKQTWQDGTSTANAESLNHIEDGIYQNSLNIDKNSSVTLKSNSAITSATIKSLNGYGIVFIVSSLYVCVIQLNNNTVNIQDVFGNHQDMTVSADGNKQFTVSGLHNWDHYIIIGSNVIEDITLNA